jgi:uncharacterized protein (TIGR00255 family)
MTGFAGKEKTIKPFGKISIELRSSNHKFMETVLHLPEGFLSLEERIKKEIESRIKRGRITCVINISGSKAGVFVNKNLLKNYIATLKNVKKKFGLRDEISIDTLVHLPGVLSLEESRIPAVNIWPRLKLLVESTLDNLVKTRSKEGKALQGHLKNRAELLKKNLEMVKIRFRMALRNKLGQIKTDEERASFLKDTDITEEIERLAFHIRNFKSKISKAGPLGKELDFIAQEMQREANTIAAKSFDVAVSARIIQIKSQIEKIREQVQNIE